MGNMIGLSGAIASGKGLVRKFFEQNGFEPISTGDYLSGIYHSGLSHLDNVCIDRINLQAHGLITESKGSFVYRVLRNHFGKKGYIQGNYLFDALRSPQQVRDLASFSQTVGNSFYLLRVMADSDKRQERFELRAEDKDSIDFRVSFINADNNDLYSLQKTSEVLSSDFPRLSIIKIENNGDVEELFAKIDSFYKSLKV